MTFSVAVGTVVGAYRLLPRVGRFRADAHPHALGPIFVQATLQVAVAIIGGSGLSYLGFGIQSPMATWGNMLKDAQAP